MERGKGEEARGGKKKGRGERVEVEEEEASGLIGRRKGEKMLVFLLASLTLSALSIARFELLEALIRLSCIALQREKPMKSSTHRWNTAL